MNREGLEEQESPVDQSSIEQENQQEDEDQKIKVMVPAG